MSLEEKKKEFDKIDLITEESTGTSAHLVPEATRQKYWQFIEELVKKKVKKERNKINEIIGAAIYDGMKLERKYRLNNWGYNQLDEEAEKIEKIYRERYLNN